MYSRTTVMLACRVLLRPNFTVTAGEISDSLCRMKFRRRIYLWRTTFSTLIVDLSSSWACAIRRHPCAWANVPAVMSLIVKRPR